MEVITLNYSRSFSMLYWFIMKPQGLKLKNEDHVCSAGWAQDVAPFMFKITFRWLKVIDKHCASCFFIRSDPF